MSKNAKIERDLSKKKKRKKKKDPKEYKKENIEEETKSLKQNTLEQNPQEECEKLPKEKPKSQKIQTDREKREERPKRREEKKGKKKWRSRKGIKKLKEKKEEDIPNLSEIECFFLGFEEFKSKIEELSAKFNLSEYLFIDLLMMAIKKIIPPSYLSPIDYFFDIYIKHLEINLKKRYNLKISQYQDLKVAIDDVFAIFNKFNFDLFKCDWSNRRDVYFPRIYEDFKDIIIQKISAFVNNFDFRQKVVLWLLNYWFFLRETTDFYDLLPTFIKETARIAFSIKEISEELIIDTIMSSGIGHFGDFYYFKGGNIKNLQENRWEYYDFWTEIPAIKEILEEIKVPDFSQEIQNFHERFDINRNYENIIEFIALEYIIKRNSITEDILNDFLDNIAIDGSKKFLDHPKIVKNVKFNIFIKEQLNSIIEEIKGQIYEKFTWLIEILKTNFNGNLDDQTEYGKQYYVEFNGKRYYIEICPWYCEEILKNAKSDKIIIFLYHPKIKYLRESFFNIELMPAVIAFGEGDKIFFKGCNETYQNLQRFFNELNSNGYSLILPEIVYEQKEQDEYIFLDSKEKTVLDEEREDIKEHFDAIKEHIEGGDGIPKGSNLFWELFEWDEKQKEWDSFQTSLNSNNTMCIFLIPKDNKIIAKNTILKLLAAEYRRKFGKLESSHNFEDLSDSEINIITIHPKKVEAYINKLKKGNQNELMEYIDDIMKRTDYSRGTGKILIIFECTTDENIDILYNDVFRKITNTHKLKSKYSTLPEDIYLKISKQLMEILSISSYSSRIDVYPENLDDLFSMLDKIRINYYNKLPLDNDWIRIKPSRGGEDDEHLKLKLIAYKKLIKEGYKHDVIKVEVPIDKVNRLTFDLEVPNDKTNRLTPDLEVPYKIWIEAETLLGSKGPNYLIQDKFQNKKENIKQYTEFWLILPNFEIFMHKKFIKKLCNQLFNLFEKEVIVKIFGIDIISKNLCLFFRSKKLL